MNKFIQEQAMSSFIKANFNLGLNNLILRLQLNLACSKKNEEELILYIWNIVLQFLLTKAKLEVFEDYLFINHPIKMYIRYTYIVYNNYKIKLMNFIFKINRFWVNRSTFML